MRVGYHFTMPIIDVTEFDFSLEHAPSGNNMTQRTARIENTTAQAVLHVGVRSPVPWLEVFPAEFALAPGASQIITAEMYPERAKNSALAPATVIVFGQYLALDASDLPNLPADTTIEIVATPPTSSCPHCGTELSEGATECRRCGERIRLCSICGTPNTWLAKNCRFNPAHVIRAEVDWVMSPGGSAAHATILTTTLGTHLARRWSSPSFPVTRSADVLEWSAPLAAFGLIVAASIETGAGCASLHAYELSSGTPLWDFDLPDPRGIYPDRGAMALSEDGILYAATLGGNVIAIDAIRGTRRWSAQVQAIVYGGVTLAENYLIIPADMHLIVLDRQTGSLVRTLTLTGRIDTAPAAANGVAYAASDDNMLHAFSLETGGEQWQTKTDGPFDAAPFLYGNKLYAAAMSGSLYALDIQTGKIDWKTNVTEKSISVTPAVSADGLLFVAADDGFVHIIAADTGHLIRSRRVSNSPLRSSPVCSGNTVFVAADDGNLYTLDADYNVELAYETTPGARIASAGLALYGDTLVCTATNGLLYVLRAIA
jgi:outer membrane protein assembly factor BamB